MKPSILSPRLAEIVDALPLQKGMRVLEIGCGTGAAARALTHRLGEDGFILAIDRSAKAVSQTKDLSQTEIAAGRMQVRQIAIEDFVLEEGEALFDLAFTVRVGALDGRHPELEKRALERLAKALKPEGKLLINGGDPLREKPLRNDET